MSSPIIVLASTNVECAIRSIEVVINKRSVVNALPNIPTNPSTGSTFVKYVRNPNVKFDIVLKLNPNLAMPQSSRRRLRIFVETVLDGVKDGVYTYDALPGSHRGQTLVQPMSVIPMILPAGLRPQYLSLWSGIVYRNPEIDAVIRLCWCKESDANAAQEVLETIKVALRDQEECVRRGREFMNAATNGLGNSER